MFGNCKEICILVLYDNLSVWTMPPAWFTSQIIPQGSACLCDNRQGREDTRQIEIKDNPADGWVKS